MRRGTTPTLKFTLPYEIAVSSLYITFMQRGRTILEKTIDDVTLDGKTINVELTQDDTLTFTAGQPISIQIRIRDTENKAVASQIIETTAEEVLKDGVI